MASEPPQLATLSPPPCALVITHVKGKLQPLDRPCMQAALAFTLPTLLAWRVQLRAARRCPALAAAQQQQLQQQQQPGRATGGASSGPSSVDWERAVERSQYERICAPVLDAVDAYGGLPLAVALAAVAGFVAALFTA